MRENSEVFVPPKNDRSRLPSYRVTWVEPLATRNKSKTRVLVLRPFSDPENRPERGQNLTVRSDLWSAWIGVRKRPRFW